MMTSLKTWFLLAHTVLFLLSITPTEAKVVESMSQCAEFFLEKPPQLPDILENGQITNENRYKPICQTYNNSRRFVTLYDIENKIPVFSAYKYRGGDRNRPDDTWMIEPEIEGINMMKEGYYNQATKNDYKDNKVYNRGHLFPSSHAYDTNEKISTFTLTNVVPQLKTFNSGSWQKMEICVRCVLEKYCKNKTVIEGYVVTGAKPGINTLGKKKINIPSVLWSAFCCHSHNENKWLASAHWGDNTPEGSTSEYLQTKTLEELQQQLNIEVFPGKTCPPNKTVSEFYPNLASDCQCPPQPSTTSASPTYRQLIAYYVSIVWYFLIFLLLHFNLI